VLFEQHLNLIDFLVNISNIKFGENVSIGSRDVSCGCGERDVTKLNGRFLPLFFEGTEKWISGQRVLMKCTGIHVGQDRVQ
jgi:hypothetical protein